MFIRTERLFLRPAWPEDWQELHHAIADERVIRNLARAPWPYTPADAQAFAARPQDRRYPHFLITLPGSRVIGGIWLHETDGGAELGYWLTPEVWGRGYATEAASAVLRLARTLGHRIVVAKALIDNPASGRVLEKVGLRRTERICDVYSLGRNATVPALEYAVAYPTTCDCDEAAPQDGCDQDMEAA